MQVFWMLFILWPMCFFYAAVIEPLPSREENEEYLSRYINPVLLRGLTELCMNKPLNPIVSIRSYMCSLISQLFRALWTWGLVSCIFAPDRFGLQTGSSKTTQTNLKYVKQSLWKRSNERQTVGKKEQRAQSLMSFFLTEKWICSTL